MYSPAHSLRGRLAGVALVTSITFALAATVSPTPSAAATGGCTFKTRTSRVVSLTSFKRGMAASRKAFFRGHRQASARRAFVRAQGKQLTSLRRSVQRCAGKGNGVAENLDPQPPPCAPSLYSPARMEMNEGTENSVLPLKPAGADVPAVMLFVDFPDLHATESTRTLYDGLVPPAHSWYSEVSYGHVDLQVTPINRWFRMPSGIRDYSLADGISWPEHYRYISDAIHAADDAVDFSQYKIVYIVAAKGTPVSGSPAFQAYAGSGVDVDGTEIRYAATYFEDTKDNLRYAVNVFTHETGHILGLPDLYAVGDDPRNYWNLFRYAGGWDTMSWNDPGAHFLAWEKWKLGWLDSSQLTCLDGAGELTTTITPLERAGGLKAVVVPTGVSSAFVIEARRAIGKDSRLCEKGVLVYQVYGEIRSGQGPVRISAAQHDTNQDLLNRCGPLYNAPYDKARGEVALFDDPAAGLSVRVLSSKASGYRVKVTRTLVTPRRAPDLVALGSQSGPSLAPPQQPPGFVPVFLANLGWDLSPPMVG